MRKAMMFRSFVALGVCLVVAGAVTAIAQEKTDNHPDLSGEWLLNRDLSAEPRQSEERRGRAPGGDPEGRGGAGGGRRGGWGGGRRGGLPGGSGGEAGGDERKIREQMEGAQDLIRDAPASMVVTYSDPKLAIAAADGRTRTLYSDKRTMKTANGNAEVQAHWDGDRLVAETKFGSLKVVEAYTLAANGKQLIVTARLDAPGGGRGERPTMELRRVYDRLRRDDTSGRE